MGKPAKEKKERTIAKICAFSVLMVCIFGGCVSKSEDDVSKGVETVIDTMLTCPNDALCPDISVIGMGTEEYNKDNQDNLILTEDILPNWEEKAGNYFAEGKLKAFLNNGPGLTYLAQAQYENIQIQVVKKQLVEKTETTETVKVTAVKAGEEFEVSYVFTFDSDGLITKVTE